jgi:multidrug resistance efflux pump
LYAVLVLAALVSAPLLLGALDAEEKPFRVQETARVERRDIRSMIRATGVVKPRVGAMVKVGCQATGLITRLHAQVGQRVRKGDLIAEIDGRELAARQAEAEAALECERAELRRIETVYPLRIGEAQAQLAKAEAREDYAALTLERVEGLVSQNLEPPDALDAARVEHRVAANEVRTLRARLERLRGEQAQELAKARQTVRRAESALETIRVRLSHTRIRSPINGVVSRVAAQEGETVVAGLQVANLITIVDPTRLEMQIFVDENDVPRVVPGREAAFQVEGYPDRTFHGRVERVSPEPEIRDNLVYYLAMVPLAPDTARLLRPEMTAACTITAGRRKDAPALPKQALKWVDGEEWVFVLDGEELRRVKPKLGLEGAAYVEVLDGVAVGDEVATRLELGGDDQP